MMDIIFVHLKYIDILKIMGGGGGFGATQFG